MSIRKNKAYYYTKYIRPVTNKYGRGYALWDYPTEYGKSFPQYKRYQQLYYSQPLVKRRAHDAVYRQLRDQYIDSIRKKHAKVRNLPKKQRWKAIGAKMAKQRTNFSNQLHRQIRAWAPLSRRHKPRYVPSQVQKPWRSSPYTRGVRNYGSIQKPWRSSPYTRGVREPFAK
jgi:hypothetical protein